MDKEKMLDEEKDKAISEKLKKDKIISKKADDVFNDFLAKTDFSKIPKENSHFINYSENENLPKENIKTEKINFSKAKKKLTFTKKIQRIAAVAACFVVVVGSANVYATSKGYENIFFMIKYFVTGENKVVGKEELLSDRDIIISNEPIRITNSLQLKINNIQIKDNKAKLFLILNKTSEITEEISFKVYDEQEKLLSSQNLSDELKMSNTCHQELVLENFKNDNKKIKLDILEKDKKIITLKIDLQNREVLVEGSKEAVEKISEIDLKKYLDYLPVIEKVNKSNSNTGKLELAESYYDLVKDNNFKDLESLGKAKTISNNQGTIYDKENTDKLIESMGILPIEINENDKNRLEIVKLDGKDYYFLTIAECGVDIPKTLNITNIEYLNGKYNLTFNYYYQDPTGEDFNDKNIEISQMIASFSLNEEKAYICKYKLEEVYENVVIQEAKKENIEENIPTENSNEEISKPVNNYASKMSWTSEEAFGMEFKYPTTFTYSYKEPTDKLLENEGYIEGIAIGRKVEDSTPISSKMIFHIYEPQELVPGEKELIESKQDKIHTANNMTWVLYDILESDDWKEEVYKYIDKDNKVRKIKIGYDKHKTVNYKVINIINWFFGSLKEIK